MNDGKPLLKRKIQVNNSITVEIDAPNLDHDNTLYYQDTGLIQRPGSFEILHKDTKIMKIYQFILHNIKVIGKMLQINVLKRKIVNNSIAHSDYQKAIAILS